MNFLECKFLSQIAEPISFWDEKVWKIMIQFGIIAIALLVGNTLRTKIKFIRNSLVPTTVIGGIILLLLKLIPWFDNLIDKDFMEIITYHTLGLGFIAMALKVNKNSKKDNNKLVIMDTGILTVNGYLLQGALGLLITLVLSLTFMPDLYRAAGLLLPMGYGQGPGQALNFGKVFEADGFVGGASFGLTIAAVGFLFACIGGVIYLNILNKKGKINRLKDNEEDGYVSMKEVSSSDEIPLTESIDKFTMQIIIVLAVYLVVFLVMYGLGELASNYLGNFGTNTVKPLIWGFNFLFGVAIATLFKKIMEILRKKKIMKRQYPNDFMLNRISGFMFDLMIITGIAAIELEDLGNLFIPLIILCVIGGIATLDYLRFVCNKIYPEYPNEAFFSMFGMLTGTASTGMLLLREIDPKFETPAANNLIFQSLPAILFGFPLLLLIPVAAKSVTIAFIILGVIIIMFVAYNIILFRKFIFKKKKVNDM